jgi:hypothetical protein
VQELTRNSNESLSAARVHGRDLLAAVLTANQGGARAGLHVPRPSQPFAGLLDKVGGGAEGLTSPLLSLQVRGVQKRGEERRALTH